MKKSKGQTIDSFYINKNENKKKNIKKKKSNNVGAEPRVRPQRKKTKTKTNNEDTKIINLDNEIIIGLTPKKEEVKRTKEQKTKKTNKKTISKNKKTVGADAPNRPTKNKKINSKNANKKQNPKNKRKSKIIKWIILLLLLLTAIVLFMMSSIFNIKQILVINNSKISSEEIVNLSTLTPGMNMFKTTNNIIRNNLKANPYIEDVKVKRNINGTVTLEIKERIPTYLLKFSNSYVYINNQGYMLEVSKDSLKLPIIIGFETPIEEIKAGNRLIVEDLKKLEDVIKILESAKSISMDKLITKIDITNSFNYILTIASEGKTVQLGDCSNINVKLLKVQAIIEKEKGIEGEIYFQDIEKTVFREKV